jgi:D-alanyl-D-alanine carboxypeptidase (penicillin-binding protein 5/6)
MRPSRIGACLSLLPLLLLGLTRPSLAIETTAREAFMIDAMTSTVLLNKDADNLMPPASMSKIMTTLLVFDRLRDGRLSMDDEFTVSEKAWKKGGSKMFVEVGKRVRVEDLLRGVIVQSGNDACIVLAEGIAGSEEAFAELMNARAREIGMVDSHFTNATGWPDPEHHMTARELALLAEFVIETYPEYYPLYSERVFTWNGIEQQNRNPLLYRDIGADGLKTGHTEAAGYGLTASAVRDGRRLILVVNGLDSMRARGEESERLLDWGFREFKNLSLFEAGEAVTQADVWFGESDRVSLVAERDVVVTLPRNARDELKVTVLYEGPIPAPIEAGAPLGTLKIEAPGIESLSIPLQAEIAVARQGVVGRAISGLKHMMFGSAKAVMLEN